MKTKIQSVVAIFAALFCMGAGLNAQPITNFSEFFDTDTAGQPPPGWGQDVAGLGTVVNDGVYVSSPNSLLFSSTGGNAIYKNLSPAISAGNLSLPVQFTFSINPSQTNQSLQLWVANSGGAPITIIGFNASHQITSTTTGGSALVVAPSYSSGLWYDVTVSFIPNNETYDISVSQSSTVVGSLTNETFQTLTTNFAQVYIAGYGGATAHFDNMQVLSAVPEPASAAMVGMGLILLVASGVRARTHGRKGVHI